MLTCPSRNFVHRELIYTAVTRAKQRMTMVGEAKVLHDALTKTVRRASGIEAELWEKNAD